MSSKSRLMRIAHSLVVINVYSLIRVYQNETKLQTENS